MAYRQLQNSTSKLHFVININKIQEKTTCETKNRTPSQTPESNPPPQDSSQAPPSKMCDKSKAPPPPTKGLKAEHPHSARAYVKMCVCMCVCVCVCAHMTRHVPNVMVSMCLYVMEPPPPLPTLVCFTCQMCLHGFVLASF